MRRLLRYRPIGVFLLDNSMYNKPPIRILSVELLFIISIKILFIKLPLWHQELAGQHLPLQTCGTAGPLNLPSVKSEVYVRIEKVKEGKLSEKIISK